MAVTETQGWKRVGLNAYVKEIGEHVYTVQRLHLKNYIMHCDGERVGFPGAWEKLSDAKRAAHRHADNAAHPAALPTKKLKTTE